MRTCPICAGFGGSRAVLKGGDLVWDRCETCKGEGTLTDEQLVAIGKQVFERARDAASQVECLDGVVMWLQRVNTNDVNEPAYLDLVKIMAPYINVRGYGWSGPLAVFKAEYGPSAEGNSDARPGK